ncbi:hypothetical protein [Nocardioides montaniterrae]
MRARLLAVLVTVVAIGAAALVVWVAPPEGAAEAPFFEHGKLRETVRLEYADVTATQVATADQLDDSGDAVIPAGTFLVVDVEVVARHQAADLEGVYLRDAGGRLYAAAQDAGCTEPGVDNYPTAVRFYARFCFDVPQRALPGVELLVARSKGERANPDWRRDDVAAIDLGISSSEASALWDADDVLPAEDGGIEEPDADIHRPTEPGEADPMIPSGQGAAS